MPLFAMGLNNEEIPFAFGSALPKLIFRWGLNNAEVVNLEDIYKQVIEIEHSFCSVKSY